MRSKLPPATMRRQGPAGALFRALLLTALVSSLAGPGLAERWLPLGREAAEARQPALERRGERRREVEALTAPLRAALPRPETLVELGLRSEEPDTAMVMVCLLAFRENRRPDLTTVPPDGRFMMPTDSLPDYFDHIDPPPHDSAYFDAHMRALREFYRIQSYGRLHIEWDILDLPGGDPFLLPDIADYGPGEMEDEDYWTLELLEAFVRTALDSIDATLQAVPDGPRFADYEHVMIFHAGSDLQNDIYRDSPNDLPSFNIFFGEPDSVDAGETELYSVLLLPETTIQDVDQASPVLGALNAVTAHEFAHQLNLVDTYNTLWGWPSVGYWDLMDSGHQILWALQTEDDPDNPLYVYGALPTSLSIWHRMLLDWVSESDSSLLRPGGGEREITLAASNLQTSDFGPKALRVDLSDREYFLLESRQELLQPRGRYLKSDEATGVFQFISVNYPQSPDSAENSGEYDLLIPQSGLLAWHVDERDFETIYWLNEINPDHDRHFRLVEADGGNDLGNPYSWDWRGNDRDPFYTGNNTLWTPTTTPSTRLRDGTASGFTLSELVTSPYLDGETFVDRTISFRIELAGIPAGYPRDDGGRVDSVLAQIPAAGTLLPFGDRIAYFLSTLRTVGADTLEQSFWLRSGLEAGGDPNLEPLAPLPAVARIPSGAALLPEPVGVDQAWVFLKTDSVFVWAAPSEQPEAEQVFAAELPVPPQGFPVTGAAPGGSWAAWVDVDAFLTILSLDRGRGAPRLTRTGGRPAREDGILPQVAQPVAVSTPSGTMLIIVADTRILRLDPLAPADSVVLAGPDPEGRPFWIRPVDVDDDGYEDDEELFWIGEDGRVIRLGIEGFTQIADLELGAGGLAAPPIVADLDADGRPELLLAAGSRVHRLSTEGHPHANWPLRLDELADLDETMRVGSSGLRAADMDGDGVSELILFSQTGHLIVTGADAKPILGTPRSLAAAAPVDFYCPGGIVLALSQDAYLLGFTGQGATAEWSLAGGGSGRQGRWRRQHEIEELSAFAGEGWVLYPNPAGETVHLHHGQVAAGTRVALEVFDLEGQRRFGKEDTSISDGPFELDLELHGLAPAVYFCRVEVSEGDSRSSFTRSLAVLR